MTQEGQKPGCLGPQQQESMDFSNGFGDTILSHLQQLWNKKYNCPALGQVARPVSISYIP